MIVAGIMSGTSADGIDVAVARITGRGAKTRSQLLAHQHFRYPNAVRRSLLELMNSPRAKVAEIARMDFLLGELYAAALAETLRKHRLKAALAGCHGQTIYHQGEAMPFLGKRLAATWQLGEAAVVAARLQIPVVSDFRPADLAAGGKGAPLVPLFDWLTYRHQTRGRILQNLGGIANLTAIPVGAKLEEVMAFDTGPGNMVIDGCMESLFDKRFDRNGALAARGRPLATVVERCLAMPFFRRQPPKTAGREEFGREFVWQFLKLSRRAQKEDIIATATELTARSIALAVRDFVVPTGRYHDLFVAGGGANNGTLMKRIAAQLAAAGVKLSVRRSEDAASGVPSEAKEALAFALLAYRTWNGEPGNVPSATGALRAVVLGKISAPGKIRRA